MTGSISPFAKDSKIFCGAIFTRSSVNGGGASCTLLFNPWACNPEFTPGFIKSVSNIPIDVAINPVEIK